MKNAFCGKETPPILAEKRQMEACEQLIRWIALTDLENLDHAQGMSMVRAAVEALESVDEDPTAEMERAFDVLLDIHDSFLNGGLPASELREFSEQYGFLFAAQITTGPSLEEQLRAMAEELGEDDWCTGSYLKLEAGIDAFEQGDSEGLASALEDLELVIQQAWESYSNLSIAQSEITAESVAGHGMLQEGVREWFAALDRARAASRDEAEWDEALEIAESANRMLVAVSRFSQRSH